jgi:TRAP-type C4-dicarboxylate transport system substrate-binding protein
MKLKFWPGLLSLGLVLALAMPAAARVLKINESLGPGSVEEAALQRFKEIVEERTNGDLEIRIFLQDQLGNPQTSLENLRTGSLDLYSGAMEYYAGMAEAEMAPLSLPFLLQDHDHMRRYLESDAFQPAKDKLLERGIRFLSTDFNGDRGPYRVFLSSSPVRSLDDLQGMKMRMFPNEIAIGAWETLGAVPVQIPWTETYLAIRQGTVSAVTAPLSAIRSMKFTEVAPYVLRTNEWPQTWPITISERVWQDLPAEQQQILVDAANEATAYYAELTYARAADDIAAMEQENGAEFVEIDMAPWQERMQPFHKKLVDDGVISPEIYDAVVALAGG